MSIDVSLWVTVLGTVFAILIPIISWKFSREEHRQLDVVIDKNVAIVNQLVANLENLSIVVDGRPATSQVVWITGWIINAGNYDISDRIVEYPLKLVLPEDMSWLRGNIEHCSTDVSCEANIKEVRELEFKWMLLRSGEYIRFDALLQCPLDSIEDADLPLEQIRPYSRIENVRTGPLIPLSDVGERYNPLRIPKLYIGPKIIVTLLAFLVFTPMWMRVFTPFYLDQLFGDGFLQATPRVVRIEGNEENKVGLFVSGDSKIKVTFNGEMWYFETARELFARQDIQVGEVRARDMSKETVFVALLGILTILVAWMLLYMWAPGMFLFQSARKRTAAALFALQRQKVGRGVAANRDE